MVAQLPVDVATYLINEKRQALNEAETRAKTEIVLVPNPYMERPAYEIRRLRDDEVQSEETRTNSYQLAQRPTVDVDAVANRAEQKPVTQQAAVTTLLPAAPAPVASEQPAPQAQPERVGIFVALWRFFFGAADKTDKETESPVTSVSRRPERNDRQRNRHERNDRRGERGRDRDDKRTGRRDENRPDNTRSEARPEQRGEQRRDDRQRDEQRREQHAQRQREQQERRREREAQRPASSPPPPTQEGTAASEQSTQSGAQADAFPGEGQQQGERRGRRNRRRRGGRGRGSEARTFGAPGSGDGNAATGQASNEGFASTEPGAAAAASANTSQEPRHETFAYSPPGPSVADPGSQSGNWNPPAERNAPEQNQNS